MAFFAKNAVWAWLNVNMEPTEAERDSYNMDAFTDNGTGDITVNMTNSLSNTNYVVAVHSSRGTGDDSDCLSWPSIANKTTSSFTVHIGQTNSGFSSTISHSNLAEVCDIIVFGK
jgi:hypothetical protein|tara:strand:- start:47 stop:391 length:345 start_codon:yes stop_codon:yes gene_type:complete